MAPEQLAQLCKMFGLDRACYSRRETQEKLNLGQTKIDELIADGTLKSLRLGDSRKSKRLILATSIAELLAKALGQPAE
jgi:hypothetical protein